MNTCQGIRHHTSAGPFWRLVQSALAAAAIVIAGPASSGQYPSNDATILVDATPGVVSFFVSSTEASDGMLTVRIADAMGETVFEIASTAGYVEWMPAELPADGTYNFDAWYSPASAGDSPESAIIDGVILDSTKGHSATEALYQSGTLSVEFGEIETHPVSASAGQRLEMSSINHEPSLLENVAGATLEFLIPAAKAEQVFVANVRIQKSSPLLIYEDTLSGQNDWDTGSNAFFGGWFLRDLGTSNVVFRVNENAPANSLFVESTGDIGLGTSTPEFKLHITDAAPGIRFEDNNDDGQLWQTYVTAKDFVIRDQTNATAPVRIRDATPTNMLELSSSGANLSLGSMFVEHSDIGPGKVGIGTFSPAAPLHVKRSNGTSQVRVEETSGTQASRVAVQLINNGSPLLRYQDTGRGITWTQNPIGDSFVINKSGTGAFEFQLFGDGSAEFQGDVTANSVLLTSSRETKTDFSPVDEATVLAKVAALDVSQWRYKREPDTERHIGPMAEDFRDVFGLGDGQHISAGDAQGILFAAAKALNGENEAKAQRIAELEARITKLEAMLFQK